MGEITPKNVASSSRTSTITGCCASMRLRHRGRGRKGADPGGIGEPEPPAHAGCAERGLCCNGVRLCKLPIVPALLTA
jgi:hypothetical protein